MTSKKSQKGIRGDSNLIDGFSTIAWKNDTTPPQLLNAVIRATLEYVEREGELPLPLKIVSKRDYERFEAWEAANRHTENANVSASLVEAKYEKADKTA
jgi:antitoxin component of RelBE/YafQ-DinJ toxin-antitoxin module